MCCRASASARTRASASPCSARTAWGKSTLFRCLLGFLEPKRGCVKIAGRDVQAYSRRALAAELAYIPQSYHPVFDHTVLESVLMGLSAQLGTF